MTDLRKEVRMALLRDIEGLTIDDMLEFFKTDNHPAASIAENKYDGCGCGKNKVVIEQENGADVLLWCWVSKKYTNHYYCETCNFNWEYTWNYPCDDKCHDCGTLISPHTSDEEYDG